VHDQIDASYKYLQEDVDSLKKLRENAFLRENESFINKVIQLKTSSQ
jgi:hypothetical protein